MFYASVDKENPDGTEAPDVFAYFLADRLGRSVSELGAMPASEYVGWASYHKVRQQAEELAAKKASRG